MVNARYMSVSSLIAPTLLYFTFGGIIITYLIVRGGLTAGIA